jgi:hypothetical protein
MMDYIMLVTSRAESSRLELLIHKVKQDQRYTYFCAGECGYSPKVSSHARNSDNSAQTRAKGSRAFCTALRTQ